ncbi:DUF721 domain-containing protein [Sphingomonas sp. CGMCC 1.13654]|uniref:DUF721 domain-containing protein n=2 Tax=Sphingomonas chungangi TaxID=2683589 RepID=A0A838L5C2_9SPHN|nr:DUF721 domain-containing protein [Sphingomonas chungangi]MVW56440.1 DUF721 domain-containing protein [Sphingomonas chungangi]
MGKEMTERTSRKSGSGAKTGKGGKTPVEPPRQNRARSVAEIVPEIGGAAFRRFGFVQSAIISRWPEIVGQRFAGVSAPESIRFPAGRKSDGVLTLTVEGAHAPMMQHVAPTLIDRVNLFFGYPAVARVQIRQGAAQPRPKPAPKPAPPSLKPVALGDSLRAVGDPELRAVLESLATGLSFTTGAPRLPEPSE